MPNIVFQPSGKCIQVDAGTQLLDAARKALVVIEASCGGEGTCGKCLVQVMGGSVLSENTGVLSNPDLNDGFVLACQTKVTNDDIIVMIPDTVGQLGGQFADQNEDLLLVRQDLLPQRWDYDPLALKWTIDVPKPQIGDGLSDLDRLTRHIQHDWGKKEVIYPLEVIQAVSRVLRADHGKVTITLIREPERYRVIDIEPGNATTRHYGIAVDIGTTTVTVQLIFLPTAQAVATRTDYNSQIECGLDVISRINYARKPERLQELRQRVLQTINQLIQQVTESQKVEPSEICNAVLAGNTTMVHLLLGLNPEFIRLEPYTPTVLQVPYLTAREVGLHINPQSWVYISPGVGSYVGGDITAGLLCTDLATDTSNINLFIDIGTNGELVIGNNDFLLTCACSAGPAFEGGGIKYGMRAARGAIERVEIEQATGRARCWTIENAKPKGICGSGVISLLANLLLSGWIDAAGKLDRNRPSSAIRVIDRIASFTIVPAEESDNGEAITISELDIDNIIRAKAAIFSACSLMLKHIGIQFMDLAKVYIAGGFGRYLDLEKAKVIGLIPDLPKEKFSYIGNASLIGAYMVLVSQDYQQRQLDLARKMTYIDLSTNPDYMNEFTGALFLPHTDINRFLSVGKKLVPKELIKTSDF